RCETVRAAAHGGVVCAWFTPGKPVAPGAWSGTGWRPMNVESRLGLGRLPIESMQQCLESTLNANGGVVCTNTGVGAKATNINTNNWCGSSSEHRYCIEATRSAKDFVVCSFPSSGTGAEAGWMRTRVTESCDYQSNKMSLAQCSASIPQTH